MYTSDSMNSMNSLLRKRVGVGHRLIFVQDFFFRLLFCLCEFVRKIEKRWRSSECQILCEFFASKEGMGCGTQTHYFVKIYGFSIFCKSTVQK